MRMWCTSLSQEVKVKSIENPEKNPKAIDNWIESITELHRSKPPATVHYTRQALTWMNHKQRAEYLCHFVTSLVYFFRPMPDIDSLMQEWPPEFEELLGKVSWLKYFQLTKYVLLYDPSSNRVVFIFTFWSIHQVNLPTADIDCDLADYVDIICGKLVHCMFLAFTFWCFCWLL